MKLDNKGIAEIGKHEGVRYKAYKDSVGVWTIGRGMTYYPNWFLNGRQVLQGDSITPEEEEKLFRSVLEQFEKGVLKAVQKPLTQNQFNALVSFAYNVGLDNFGKSTLLNKVNTNPNDKSIAQEFMKWDKGRVKGKLTPIAGLRNRRKEEADLYFS